MKLCRFELNSKPGETRSGIVHGGRIYETEGTQPVAIHEASDVTLLTPIGLAPSIRFSGGEDILNPLEAVDDHDTSYWYGNSSAIFGPSRVLAYPARASALSFRPYLGVVVASDVAQTVPEEADEFILGFTLVNVFVAREIELAERRLGQGRGRSSDLGIALGPVLTTPDELDDLTTDDVLGRRFSSLVVAKVNGLEVARGDTDNIVATAAQVIASATLSAPVRSGDILALGPILEDGNEDLPILSPGDKVEISADRLGTLMTQIG